LILSQNCSQNEKTNQTGRSDISHLGLAFEKHFLCQAMLDFLSAGVLNSKDQHCPSGTFQGYHSLGAGFEVKMMESEATRELLKANTLNRRMQ